MSSGGSTLVAIGDGGNNQSRRVGADFAWQHMSSHGWKKGDGLGRRGQGITDAIKPKLKFDQRGMGNNRSEEFEFHWWDHVFNSAAKGVSVDDSQGEVTVQFKADKSQISAKKLRRKMQKEIRSKLYSHFVKSGTLEGGKMVEDSSQEQHTQVVEEVKDLSKIKTMTDEELVKSCGGRTAHKGARHGQNMTGKLQRVADADAKFLADMLARQQAKTKSAKPTKQNVEVVSTESATVQVESAEPTVKSTSGGKKKRKKQKVEEEVAECDDTLEQQPVKKKKKKSKKSKD